MILIRCVIIIVCLIYGAKAVSLRALDDDENIFDDAQNRLIAGTRELIF